MINLLIFIGLIWVSQILRIIEFQYSISFQIFDVAMTTLLALPSFINPLVPFLILMGSYIVNFKISSSNEIIIFKQYLSKKEIDNLFKIIILTIIVIFFLNNEFLSKKFYEKYKIKELDIRNNLKLGSPSQNEFHIDDIVSIFFEEKSEDIFYNVEAIIYFENQFINSERVEIELSKSNFNLVFFEGERLIFNNDEKSKTNFDKFIYVLENKNYEELLMDKDHYNTLELISHKERDFQNHGHNKIIQYLFLFFVSTISLKVIFYSKNKKGNTLPFFTLFILILFIQIINSYLIYNLNTSDIFDVNHYYFISITLLLISYFMSLKILK